MSIIRVTSLLRTKRDTKKYRSWRRGEKTRLPPLFNTKLVRRWCQFQSNYWRGKSIFEISTNWWLFHHGWARNSIQDVHETDKLLKMICQRYNFQNDNFPMLGSLTLIVLSFLLNRTWHSFLNGKEVTCIIFVHFVRSVHVHLKKLTSSSVVDQSIFDCISYVL